MNQVRADSSIHVADDRLCTHVHAGQDVLVVRGDSATVRGFVSQDAVPPRVSSMPAAVAAAAGGGATDGGVGADGGGGWVLLRKETNTSIRGIQVFTCPSDVDVGRGTQARRRLFATSSPLPATSPSIDSIIPIVNRYKTYNTAIGPKH